MKVKIIKKSIKEGVTSTGSEYCIKSLFVSFTEPELYEKIVNHLKAMACSDESIEKFCKPNEYNGAISYSFWLNCSHFTFERVERFGVLDANIIFGQNDKGFVNAKIQIVDKKEQVNGYEAPEDFVTGWNTEAPEPVHAPVVAVVPITTTIEEQMNAAFNAPEQNVPSPFAPNKDDLPF